MEEKDAFFYLKNLYFNLMINNDKEYINEIVKFDIVRSRYVEVHFKIYNKLKFIFVVYDNYLLKDFEYVFVKTFNGIVSDFGLPKITAAQFGYVLEKFMNVIKSVKEKR